GTISVFNGIDPVIETFADADRETSAVGKWLADRIANGVPPHEIGVFVRAGGQLRRARAAVKAAGLAAVELSEKVETTAGRVTIEAYALQQDGEVSPVTSRRTRRRLWSRETAVPPNSPAISLLEREEFPARRWPKRGETMCKYLIKKAFRDGPDRLSV